MSTCGLIWINESNSNQQQLDSPCGQFFNPEIENNSEGTSPVRELFANANQAGGG